MNGLFADILKSCAHWFLYVFINADAPLNKSIMRKRNNQITWLKRLDALNTTYNYAELKEIVRQGIYDRYGKSPADVLTLLYDTAVGANVNGVGTVLETETAKATENLKKLSLTTTTPTGETKNENFWDGMLNTLEYIKQILDVLGIGKTADIQPTSTDWYKPNSTGSGSSDALASVGEYLPWVMGAAIGWFLLTSPNTEKK